MALRGAHRLITVTPGMAAEGSAASKFGPKWSSLLGEWKGENQANGPSGVCGFHFDLAEYVMVRTNGAQLTAGGPVHDDLMVIAPEPNPDRAKTMYYDNEGHVIEYTAEWSADGNTLVFSTKPSPGPQFRLTYKNLPPASFTVMFEMAPPGTANFRAYTSGKSVSGGIMGIVWENWCWPWHCQQSNQWSRPPES